MKAMIYLASPIREGDVLERNIYEGYEYAVINYGTWPCAYVRIPETHPLYGENYDSLNIACHGGLTFSGIPKFADDGYWIGWDYAHYDDFTGYALSINDDAKMWTTEEMIDECVDVIGQLMEYEG